MSAHSFLNVLLSDKSGQVDPTRDHVLTGTLNEAGDPDGEHDPPEADYGEIIS
jgi:hypothetical protein